MLISEIKNWHWAISWDNAQPPNSASMIKALQALGTLTEVQTKTTYLLAPKVGSNYKQIRAAIAANLDKTKGNAFYANLRSGKAFEYGPKTNHMWMRVV